MIKADLKKGILQGRGALDEMLTEYTLLTRMVLHELTSLTNEETAFKIVAELGKIAVNSEDITDGNNTFDNVIEVLDNEIPV